MALSDFCCFQPHDPRRRKKFDAMTTDAKKFGALLL
jgi:hypothetical protein